MNIDIPISITYILIYPSGAGWGSPRALLDRGFPAGPAANTLPQTPNKKGN